jgi:hypothetical protein
LWYRLSPSFVFQTSTTAVLAALNQSSHPSVPAEFQEVIDSGMSERAFRLEQARLRTSDSRTTLHVAQQPAWLPSLGRGVPLGSFFPPTCSRRERVCPGQPLRFKRGCQ